FFDSPPQKESLGVLSTTRKPFQDSPTPAGNAMAAIALIRMYGYTQEKGYSDKAEQTLELLAGVAGQYGLFAATYGIAGVYFSEPHTQVVVVGEDENARELYRQVVSSFKFGQTAIRLSFNEAVEPNLPPSLARTITQLPAVRERKSSAIVC